MTLNRNTETLNRNIDAKYTSTIDRVNNININLETKIGDSKDVVLRRIDNLDLKITNKQTTNLREILSSIMSSRTIIISTLAEINTLIVSVAEGLIALTSSLTVTLGGIIASLATIGASLAGIETSILYNRSIIYSQSSSIKTQIGRDIQISQNKVINTVTEVINKTTLDLEDHLKKLEDKLEKAKKEIEDKIDSLVEDLPEKVSLNIVGESYFKWDSQNSYFPTLVYLFKETNVSQYPRKVQLKIRLKERNEAVTDEILSKLKTRIVKIKDLEFNHGLTRANYVSSDRRYKTTIYCNEAEDAKYVLSEVCKVIEDPFIENNLSITLGNKRTNYIKRTKPLGDIGLNQTEYKAIINVKLFKVILLVHGLQAPIILLRS